jgi:hypothetical protein
MNEASTQNLTPSRQRDKLNAYKGSKIQAGFETSGEMPAQRLKEAVNLYCHWMIRLYLERQEKHRHDERLGAA